MGSKLILLLGILAAAFLAYTCAKDNKDKLVPKYNELAKSNTIEKIAKPPQEIKTAPIVESKIKPKPVEIKPVAEVKTEPVPIEVEKKPEAKLEEPKFLYSLKDGAKLTVKLSINDKSQVLEQFILDYCQSNICTQDLTFQESVKDVLWQDDVLKIAAFLKDKSVKNGLILIDGYNLNLEGEFASKEDKDAFMELLEPYSLEIFEIENLTTIKEVIIIEEVKETIIIEEVKETTSVATNKAQDEINKLLKVNPVYFRYNSDKLTLNANAVLKKVINTLKDTGEISLRVEGHTDSGGDAAYNKTLSQKRAEAVKKYLLENGLQNTQIEAIGYGEEKPITENPTNTANRRVEIYLIKGE